MINFLAVCFGTWLYLITASWLLWRYRIELLRELMDTFLHASREIGITSVKVTREEGKGDE